MPVLFATWAYQRGGAKLAAKGWAYDEMVRRLAEVYRKAALDSGVTVRDNLIGLSPSYPTDTGLVLLRAYLYSDYPPADTLTIYGSLNQSEEDKIDCTENVVECGGNRG